MIDIVYMPCLIGWVLLNVICCDIAFAIVVFNCAETAGADLSQVNTVGISQLSHIH